MDLPHQSTSLKVEDFLNHLKKNHYRGDVFFECWERDKDCAM